MVSLPFRLKMNYMGPTHMWGPGFAGSTSFISIVPPSLHKGSQTLFSSRKNGKSCDSFQHQSLSERGQTKQKMAFLEMLKLMYAYFFVTKSLITSKY